LVAPRQLVAALERTVRNWKTSVSGIVTAAFGFVVFSPNLFARWPWLVELSKFVMAGGLVSMGLSGKDATTHSTVAEINIATDEADKVR
jgi:hypothetical protein